MRCLFLACWLLLSPSLCAADLELAPTEVVNGGVALLRWTGDPGDLVIARYRDRTIYLRPVSEKSGRGESLVLLGADVELPPGRYPVQVAAVDRRGRSTFHRLELKVRDAGRPVERLTLPKRMVTPRSPEVIERIIRERDRLRTIFDQGSEVPRWGRLRLPVDDPVSSRFGLRRILNGEPRSPHSGVDFRSPLGTPVHAAARGEVVLAEDLYFTGRTVVLDHGGGLFTLYAHLQEFDCQPGDLLAAGDLLGTVGSTGRSTGPHLHWGGKLRGDRIDPLALVELLGEEKP